MARITVAENILSAIKENPGISDKELLEKYPEHSFATISNNAMKLAREQILVRVKDKEANVTKNYLKEDAPSGKSKKGRKVAKKNVTPPEVKKEILPGFVKLSPEEIAEANATETATEPAEEKSAPKKRRGRKPGTKLNRPPKPIPILSKYITVAPSVELHYLDSGKGEPLIFVPGLTFGGEIFEYQIEHFAMTNRVIAIDPRGQGLSTKTVDGNDYLTHGKDISVLIDKLRLRNVVLIGWSTGNLDCWSYIKQFGTDRVKKLITIDMSPLPLSEDPKWWTEGTKEELSQAATEVLTSPEGMRAFFKDYAEQIMLQHPTEELVSKVLDNSGKTPYWIGRQLFCDAIFSNYLETAKDPGVPALMFIAEHWAEVAESFMKEYLPEVQRYVMGGHLMFFEYPERWNGVVEDFLKEE